MALTGLAILCLAVGCSDEPAAAPKSRFSQQGLDKIGADCGLPKGALRLEGANSVRFGSDVSRDYKKLNCVQTKIRTTYYPGAAGNESEGKNAQAH